MHDKDGIVKKDPFLAIFMEEKVKMTQNLTINLFPQVYKKIKRENVTLFHFLPHILLFFTSFRDSLALREFILTRKDPDRPAWRHSWTTVHWGRGMVDQYQAITKEAKKVT